MNLILWIVQALLAVFFALSGTVKMFQPKEKLAAKYPWTNDVPLARVRLIATMELLAAIGLIAPAATGIAPVLTPLAAAGLVLMMALAGAMHLRRKEPSGVAVTATVLVLAAFVAWGRFDLMA